MNGVFQVETTVDAMVTLFPPIRENEVRMIEIDGSVSIDNRTVRMVGLADDDTDDLAIVLWNGRQYVVPGDTKVIFEFTVNRPGGY